MAEDVSKIRAALEVLRVPNPAGTDRRSWMRGMLHGKYQGADRYCILGALEHVGVSINHNYHREESADLRVIRKVIGEQFGNGGYSEGVPPSIPGFNDEKTRTFDEVELVLEKAAILREEEGARSDWSLKRS